MPHAFAIGEHVHIVAGSAYQDINAHDIYEVAQQLPADGSGVFAYRVRRLLDGQLRAVKEAQLVRNDPLATMGRRLPK